MPSLEQVLASVPGLAGYQATVNQNNQRGMQTLQMGQAAGGILAQIAAQQQKQVALQREQKMREALSGLAPDATPDQVAGAVRPYASADDLLKTATSSADRRAGLEVAERGNNATIEAARINAEAQREARKAEIEERGRQRLEEIEARAAEGRISRAEADARALQARREMAALIAQNRPIPQPQPLVQIMGPDNKPVWVERKDAVGQTPAGAGSQAESKAAGKADVDKDIVKLKDALDRLKEGGGITDTSKPAASNIGAAIGSSAIGQTLSGAVGSKNQSARNEMLMIRPSLLRSIMASTGMSAKQMDSNAELKLWLSTATDPTKDYQANIEALNNIAQKYGSGAILEKTATQTATAPAAPASGFTEGQTATNDKGVKIIFKGGVWRPM